MGEFVEAATFTVPLKGGPLVPDEDEKNLRIENETNMMGSFIREVSENYTLSESIRSKALRYGMEALIMAGEDK